MSPFSEALQPLVSKIKEKFPTRTSSEHQESVISVEKKDISSITVPLEEQDSFEFTYKRDYDITEKTKNVSVRGRLKENIEFSEKQINLIL